MPEEVAVEVRNSAASLASAEPEQVGEATVDKTPAESAPAEPEEGDIEHDHEGKPRGGYQRRIDKLTRQKAEAEDAAEYWRKKALAFEPRKTTEAKAADDKAPVRPKQDQFSDWEAYEEAKDKYYEELADYKAQQAVNKYREEETRQTQQQTTQQRFQSQVEEARKVHADFDEVAFAREVPISPVMQEAILDSEHGALIAYELGKNLAEAQRIAKLSPVAAIREIGKIEARVARVKQAEAEPAKAVSSAPAPITPVRRASAAITSRPDSPDSDKLSDEEWMKARSAQVYGKR